jgi:transposase
MDNAPRYQRCDKVINKAKDLEIDILFLPPYSPNLNLIERLRKFAKKKCLYNQYYETFRLFKEAIDDCLEKVKSTFSEQIKTLFKSKISAVRKIHICDRVKYSHQYFPVVTWFVYGIPLQ